MGPAAAAAAGGEVETAGVTFNARVITGGKLPTEIKLECLDLVTEFKRRVGGRGNENKTPGHVLILRT